MVAATLEEEMGEQKDYISFYSHLQVTYSERSAELGRGNISSPRNVFSAISIRDALAFI